MKSDNPLSLITEISSDNILKLNRADIQTLDDLRRMNVLLISRKTGLPARTLTKWKSLATLMQIEEIDYQIASVFLKNGISDLKSLAKSDPGEILAWLTREKIARKGIDGKKVALPVSLIQLWLKLAAELSACRLAFVVSDNFRNVLELTPMAVWTAPETAYPTHIVPGEITHHPVLICPVKPSEADQTQEQANGFQPIGNIRFGQSFKPGETAKFGRMEVLVRRTSAQRDLRVAIHPGQGIFSPSLFEVIIPWTEISETAAWLSVSLPDLSLSKIQTYSITLSSPDAGDGEIAYEWAVSSGEAYPNGFLFETPGVTLLKDACFRTYFTPRFDADSTVHFLRQYFHLNESSSHHLSLEFEGGSNFISIEMGTEVAQAFVPMDPAMDKISIKCQRLEQNFSLKYAISISPEGPDLATGEISASALPLTMDWIDLPFPQPMFLTVGTPYFIRISAPKGRGGNVLVKWSAAQQNKISTSNIWVDGKQFAYRTAFRTWCPAKAVFMVGDLPSALDLWMTSEQEGGVGLSPEQVSHLDPADFPLIWNDFEEAVIVDKSNYEIGAMAAVYASFRHIPLFMLDLEQAQEYAAFLGGKQLRAVGIENAPLAQLLQSVAASYTAVSQSELQLDYVNRTRTDKMVLMNSKDLGIWEEGSIKPETLGLEFRDLYQAQSLAAPILAAGRQAVLINHNGSDYASYATFIRDQVKLFSTYIASIAFKIRYLTIFGAHNAIPFYYELNPDKENSYLLATDPFDYAKLDDNVFSDLAVGRIFGVTVGDAAAYVARALSHTKLPHYAGKMLFTEVDLELEFQSKFRFQALKDAYTDLGYEVDLYHDTDSPASEWKQKGLILINVHGSVNYGGIGTQEIPELDLPLVLLTSCSTCAWKFAIDKSELFCPNLIRKGALAAVSAVQPTGYINMGGLMSRMYFEGLDIGQSFQQAKHIGAAYLQGKGYSNLYYPNNPSNDFPDFMLVGDPCLFPRIPHPGPKPTVEVLGGAAEPRYQVQFHLFHFTDYANIKSYYSSSPQRSMSDSTLQFKLGPFGPNRSFSKAEFECEQFLNGPLKESTKLFWNEEEDKKWLWIHLDGALFTPNLNGKINPVTLKVTLRQ